ncbi:MAG: hypothetical protein ACRYG7_29085 [Janthinobacterium lividum]
MLPTNPLLNATAPAGPHLPVALLRQYAAGALAPAAQHRVEAHTLACARCADVLQGLLQTPAATTDQALGQLQQRLRQRVQQQAAPARLAQRPRRHHWLAPQLATAAALLLGLLAGGWWAWQQRQHMARPAARTEQPRLTVAPTPPATAETSEFSETGAARPVASAPTPLSAAKTGAATARLPAAVPTGGYAALRVYLQKGTARFEPKALAGPRRTGRVLVRLRIGAKGQIERAEAVRKLRADYDAEAIRLLQEGPTWMPSSDGQTVDVPVTFE